MNYRELKIKLPWGHVAAKGWGCETDSPVIALHGWQDNANSFDKLIPLLPNKHYYISLDLPSHGKSTHIPTQTFVVFTDFILTLKLVLDELNYKKYILLGHSYGGQIALVFTQMFSQYVTKLIMLDTIYFLPSYPQNYLNSLKNNIINHYKCIQSFDTAPSYTYNEILTKIISNRFIPISEEGAKVLIERSIVPTGDGKYKLSIAQHLKYASKPTLTIDYIKNLVKFNQIDCPHLIILASQTAIIREAYYPVIEVFKKNPLFKIVIVEGTHDVHIEHPERVAPFVNQYILCNNSKL